ncbi:hypothetical protein SAMN05444007_10156 [Cribrihabitans marinus]|uniref:Xaa-Pro dipeptidyl-peptidase C-terminal domain-containing protein n=1 Tax=Cribrihabitans marinus TaxID=1227549 RepID=A0A1H6QEP3_9RHOB|nr:CocE/NonD family hydrolase [Cribrihabitans marinus]GGH18295.1 hydrolase [Cribrihabitans marinus]SEI40356.1 hypothetical protein SAMN05444007_10156 [Cribrihabitans marinus]
MADFVEPRSFTEIEHLWIPMPDGIRLAARLWLPDGADRDPVPALLEYIPYRKADMVRARDARNHPYFAANGYACLRVDMRGSGDSEGVMEDMYSDHELADARHVIDWIAAQPWCSGAVGMFGTSWGGTAALQANVDAPDALKAVIAVCATHDRYEDDIHHMGGCLLTDTLEWGATLPAILAAPPTPSVGMDWMARWRYRLDNLAFPLEPWIREEARGVYWRHGSVTHQADRLSRPILAIGGWADRYSNSVMALVSARPDLTWGVVGPWGHHYPDHGHPGPAIGFQALALAWWDHWLKADAAPPDWPRLRVWLREYDRPADALDTRRGGWLATDAPQSCTEPRIWTLGAGGLGSRPQADGDWVVPDDLRIGRAAGDTGYFGRYGGLPLDQARDDALSLEFTSPPLAEDRILFGAATLGLTISTEDGRGQITARLVDVAPDGTTALISRTTRNLALDAAFETPAAGPATGRRELRLVFPTTAYRLAQGHRLRVSLSSSYWPMIWPSQAAAPPRIINGDLDVPEFANAPTDCAASLPAVTDLPRHKPFELLSAPPLARMSELTSDGTRRDGWHQPETALHLTDVATTFAFTTRADHSVLLGSPLSARSTVRHRAEYRRPDGTAKVESTLTMRADTAHFSVDARLIVLWNDQEVSARHTEIQVPRWHG